MLHVLSADSWLDGENNIGPLEPETSELSERIYSGRESPHKTIHVHSNKEQSMSAFSTSTADSFDYAFQRKPVVPPVDKTDDFFDS